MNFLKQRSISEISRNGPWRGLFILMALLFVLTVQGRAQTRQQLVQLVVQLEDSLGRPIPNASIIQRGRGVVAVSDANGECTITTARSLHVEVSHVNYLPREEYIELLAGEVQHLQWVLRPKPQFLDAVSVTASTMPKELRKIASSVSVLHRGAPELQQIQTIDEALAFVPGVMVDRSRGLTTTGTHTGVILRGTGAANRTLVLKDGVPINDAYTGGVSEWNSLAGNSLERIEVVRGPGSSIYGSSSMGGTINLVTQLPTDKPIVGADFRYGSMNTYQASLKVGKRFAKRWGAIAFAEYKHTDGYAYMADSLWKDHYQKPKMSLLNINTKLTYDFDNGGMFIATADFNQQEPISGTSTIYDDRTFTGNYQLRYHNTEAKFAPDIVVYYNLQNRASHARAWNAEELAFNRTNYISRVPLDTYGMIAKVSHSVWNHDITVGADLRFTEVASRKHYPEKGDQNFSGRQDFISFFLNDDISFTQKLHANLGLRFDRWANRNGRFADDMSGDGVFIAYDNAHSSVWTPKVGLTYDVLANLRLRSVYATGFRAPGAFYMYNAAPLGSSFRLGNPELKPERMRYSIDFGADLQLMDKLELSATVYRSQYSDFLSAVLIDASEVPEYFDPGSLPVRRYINIGKVGLWGLESSVKYNISPFVTIQASYFHNQSEIKKYEPNPEYEGKEMNDNPRNIYSGAFIYDNPRIGHISIWGRHTDTFFGDLENTAEKKMDAVRVVDLKLERRIGPMGVNLTINNVFDKLYYGSYTSPTSYYYAPGRTLFVGINYQL
ncbi:TonB-dependent receptor [Sphingobacterium gobiense]|uniref:TonB-dependent receptor n=1 Tax=Sphingobacterium gobiense TaxID=1382456 RepID=A0A2S9JUP5_9SPHI|nr:TonB-dependent receptor [Sphingobacterium gobiense]PRD57002.1 hypothetical protein C5749_07280 [Sphingobacterium gobiense]